MTERLLVGRKESNQTKTKIKFRKSSEQERFKSSLEFRYQIKVSSIKFRKCFVKFMIPIALFKKFLSLKQYFQVLKSVT